MQEAIAARAFPCASVAVTHRGRLIVLRAFGHFTYESAGALSLSRSLRKGENLDVTPSTLFDLASVTKVVATTAMAMILYERGLLDLDAAAAGTIPEFVALRPADPRRSDVSFRMLLAHSSGLPAYEKLFLKARTRDDLLRAAFTLPLTADPGSRAEYSDIGFILLGVALERLAGEPLDQFCQREIFGPLGMTGTTFNPPKEMRALIPPTADKRTEMCGAGARGAGALARELPAPATPNRPIVSTFPRGRIIQGEVQDENAYVLGGIAGHAGLFSTAEDMARFAHFMLQRGAGARGAGALARELPTRSSRPRPGHQPNAIPQIVRPETISLFTRRASQPEGTSRALGWDTPSAPSQSGKHFSPSSFGHLGYTGTSLWIDPVRQLAISLLTNRTWPDCSNQAIKQVRPRFHDAVIEALGLARHTSG